MAASDRGNVRAGFPIANDGRKAILLARGAHTWPCGRSFFQISCPVCQYAFPFLERIYKAHGGKNVTIVGVSQNEKKGAAAFIEEFGLTFPILLDDTNAYPVSNAYGLDRTRTQQVFSGLGRVEKLKSSCGGWERKAVERNQPQDRRTCWRWTEACVPQRRADS